MVHSYVVGVLHFHQIRVYKGVRRGLSVEDAPNVTAKCQNHVSIPQMAETIRIVAKMATCDRFSIYAIACSNYFMSALQKDHSAAVCTTLEQLLSAVVYSTVHEARTR